MEFPLREMFTQQFTASIAPFRQHLAACGQKRLAVVDEPQRASCSSSGEPKSSVSRVWASVAMVRDEARIQPRRSPPQKLFPAEPKVMTVACGLKEASGGGEAHQTRDPPSFHPPPASCGFGCNIGMA
jgi:hypothetical protein